MRVLFVSLTDDLGSDRLVGDMGRGGARCAVLGPSGCMASLPRCVDAVFTVPAGARAAFGLRRALQRAANGWHPDEVVPLDDLAATLLRSIGARARPLSRLRRLIRTSLGAADRYPAACQRVALMETARDAGVRVPPFAAAAAIGWPGSAHVPLPVMIKRDQSSGSGGVLRADTPRDRRRAIRRGWIKAALKAQVARLAGHGRPLTPLLVQGVVAGELAMYTAVCRDGAVIDGIGFTAVESHPVKRSSTILRHCRNAEMATATRRLVAALGCSGFVSLDFIVDREGRAFLIELNARPIGSTHLGRLFGHDLVHAFLTGRTGREETADLDVDVALFPKELERDPTGQRLDGAGILHDIPLHEPAVVAAYLARLKAEHPAHATELARRCGTATTSAAARGLALVQPEPC